MTELSQKRLKELVNYDPATGIFIAKVKRGRIGVGDILGSYESNGYLRIGIDYKEYSLHRLAFMYIIGRFPKEQVDHIDHNKVNNRWKNLRECTNQENARNQPRAKNNTSKVTGVYRRKDLNKWQAYIKVRGKLINLGQYFDKEEAIKVRKNKEIELGFHVNHGNFI